MAAGSFRLSATRTGALILFGVIALACARWATAGGEWLEPAASARALPSLDGATSWINSPPLDATALRGHVVLIDFWTYSCINCLRTLPYVRAWQRKYASHGFVVIGVHTPEFNFEHAPRNIQRAVGDLGIDFPVAVDSQKRLWSAFGTRAWPTFYFVDGKGRIRHVQLGEGGYAQAELTIQQLLREAGRTGVPTDLVAPQAVGTQAAAGAQPPASEETYLGIALARGFVAAAGGLEARRALRYAPAPRLALNQWTLQGDWKADAEHIQVLQAGGHIAYRFRARDLHLVLGPDSEGRPVRFRVRIDGHPPGGDHGSDVDTDGNGRIDTHRLYQLIRQDGSRQERLFEIEFLDPGARAYAFTFG
ncbi:MAG TPA: redoxin family protein [Roseateles sp.]|nr:redoxin family protein [Roseateles sp.]